MYDRRDVAEARRDLAAWLAKWQGKYPRLCDWVETNIEDTFAFYCLSLAHHKHLKSTNMLERFNEDVKRRSHVVRILPNEASCLRLIRYAKSAGPLRKRAQPTASYLSPSKRLTLPAFCSFVDCELVTNLLVFG